jgi:hypothetical protein
VNSVRAGQISQPGLWLLVGGEAYFDRIAEAIVAIAESFIRGEISPTFDTNTGIASPTINYAIAILDPMRPTRLEPIETLAYPQPVTSTREFYVFHVFDCLPS